MRSYLKIIMVASALFAVFSAFSIISLQKPKYIDYPSWNNYESFWTRVDSLKEKGLNNAALKETRKIYSKAKRENNAPQLIKAIINQLSISSLFEEEAEEKTIAFILVELKEVNYPAKPILHSILAELYWKYYQHNRYRFLDRSATAGFDNDDIRTWDLKKIYQTVIYHYELSLQNPDSLRRTRIDLFEPVIIKGDSTAKKLRPSLYDFLAHRALDFYMSEESGLILPSFHFELKEKAAFLPYDKFISYKFSTRDTASVKFKALHLLQDILHFHQHDSNPGALIDADIKRLKFSHSNASLIEKDSLFLSGLKHLKTTFDHHPGSAEVAYEIALFYFSRGSKYEPYRSPDYKWDLKKAFEICDETVKKFFGSLGAVQCGNLLATIQQGSLLLTTEKTVPVNTRFLGLFTYKNMEKVFVRISQTPLTKFNDRNNDEDLLREILKQNSLKQWAIELPDDGDFQEHSTEIAMPELAAGTYTVIVSNNETFDFENGIVAYAFVNSTNISFFGRQSTEVSFDVYVKDRNSGLPLKRASVITHIKKYDYKTRDYYSQETGKYLTDDKGYVLIPTSNENRNFFLEIIHKNDLFYSDNSLYQYRPQKSPDKKWLKTWFFTDRSIYRPGQTIYFKGIIIETNGESNQIKANHSTTTALYDVNHRKIADLHLISNEYGTFSGSFTLPSEGLTGNMHIKNESGSFFFSVEEYKRPKFEVVFQPVQGTYKPGDKLKVKGNAQMYSGAAIDGAEVKYRVVRNVSYPNWWYHYRIFPEVPQMEIEQGILETNQQGEFEIEFLALPDNSHFSENKPLYYHYTIYADVTDISGETRSAEKTIPVGYAALIIQAEIPSMIDKKDSVVFTFKTSNLEGKDEPAKVDIKVSCLEEPERILRERLWKRPDKFILSKEEFITMFPHDPYDNEGQLEDRKIAERVHSTTINTETENNLKLGELKNWKSGTYLIEASAYDQAGNKTEEKIYFTLYSREDNTPAINAPLFFEALNKKAEPGENAIFLIGSKEKNVRFLFEIEHKNKIVKREWHTLSNEQEIIEIPVEEQHRGNFTVHVVAVKNNRNYIFSSTVIVPFTNKELYAEFETFRDKLRPGEQEEWKIKIRGANGDKIASEMVASLYDASLDAFKKHHWNFNIYNTYSPSLNWLEGLSFGTVSTITYSFNWNNPPQIPYRIYDQLNWFDYTNNMYSHRNGYSKSEAFTMRDAEITGQNEIATDEADKALVMEGSKEKSEANNVIPEGASINIRKNFNETAFFYPHLSTDESGIVIIKFTLPESLTRWKLLGFFHTADLKFGHIEKELVAQKELMVSPIIPRFFREGDEIFLTASIINLTDEEKKGNAKLELLDPFTMKPVAGIGNEKPEIEFKVNSESSTAVKWKVNISEGQKILLIRITAKAGSFSDGEEIAVPVLTNRILITESLPLSVRGQQTKNFRFEKLINQKSPSLKNHQLILEFSSNPAWYAVQALPYLMEFPYDNSDQVFNRYYANAIASHIANSSPKVKAIFDYWKNYEPDAFLSALEKNAELKNILLEETPWLLQSQNEKERKKRIALLFDLNKMAAELSRAESKLLKMQTPNGGFPWFTGMEDDRYITQYIVTGWGRLNNLGIESTSQNQQLKSAIEKAIFYLDERINEDYKHLIKVKADTAKKHISALQVQYFYARSYYSDLRVAEKNRKAYDYFLQQMKTYWLSESRYIQAMTALSIQRSGEKNLAVEIISSIKDNALFDEEMGMYWKENTSGYFWYQAPIEIQALFIEAFDEITNDEISIEAMKIWLLKQKQTQDWKTPKATAEACYALLLRGNNLLEVKPEVNISMGKHKLNYGLIEDEEAGTGYFKTIFNASQITADMGKVIVEKKNEGIAWGAVYWQYFEKIEKVTSHQTGLRLNKKIYLETNSESGPQIIYIDKNTVLKPGDRIIVRIELQVDRAMEYVHLKDLRASGFEPENILSQYKYRDGLAYYESTKDAATNFFFSYLPKGVYVFEYPLRIVHSGNFSAGLATIQCMYAPDFTSHSEGLSVEVKE